MLEPVSYAKATTGPPTKKSLPPSPASGARTTSPAKKRQPRTLPLRETSPQKAKAVEFSAASPAVRADMTQGYRNFAAGGHIESDKKFAAMAEQENVEARQKRLDEENYEALFGGTEQETGAEQKKDTMKLVRTKNDGKGVWKGTMEVPQATKGGSKKNENSLLDE